MNSVVSYYGGPTKFDVTLIDELWRSYQRFPLERFQRVVSIVFKNCTFPPKLADFIRADEERRAEDRLAGAFGIKPEEAAMDSYEPVFPTDEWFAENMACSRKGLRNNTDAEIAAHMKQMIRLRNIMIINYRSYKQMTSRGPR